MLAARRLDPHDPGNPIPVRRSARLRRFRVGFWTIRRIRLGFLIGGLVFGAAAVVESAVEIGRGRWSPTLTLLLFALGAGLVGLNILFPTSRETASRVSMAAWPIGGAFMAILALLRTTSIDVDAAVTPFGGGLGLALAALLAVDRVKGNRLAQWDDVEGGS